MIDCAEKFAMIAVQGPQARALVAGLADGSLPLAHALAASGRSPGAAMLVCGTGYTGEDGVELLLDPRDAPAVWDALVAAGAAPVGLGARDTLRLEACFHLYGNDLSEDRDPIGAGLGWCCKEADRLHRRRGDRRVRGRPGPAEKLVPFMIDGPGIARAGQSRDRRRRGDERNVLALPRARDRDGLCSRGARRARHADRDRRAGHEPAPPTSSASPCTERGRDHGRRQLSGRPALPRRARLGARRRRRRATFGITWFAQDALGEVVFFDPPEVGATVTKDEPYTEVESVKAVSDVIAPLSGEILEVNDALADTPETINEDPYGEGWLVKVKLSDPSETERADGRRGLRGARFRERRYASATDADRREMLATIGVGSIEELFADIPEALRLSRAARARRGPLRAGGVRGAAGARRAQRLDRGRALVPRRRACTTTTSRR